MGQVLQEVLTANQEYVASFGDEGNSPLPPGRRFAILTRMDARLDPVTIPSYDYIYDLKTGQSIEVPKATEVGKALAIAEIK